MATPETLVQTALIGEALEHAPALVFVADSAMRYVAVNQRACDVLGYTREELLALHVTDVADYEDAIEEFAEMLRTRVRRGTSRLRKKDGGTVSVSYTAGETQIAGLVFYVSVATVE